MKNLTDEQRHAILGDKSLSLTDNHGRAIVTVRGYKIDRDNTRMQKLFGRILAINSATATARTIERTYNIVSREVNRGLRGAPATSDELLAALESRITIDGLIHKIQEMRDPQGYYSETPAA